MPITTTKHLYYDIDKTGLTTDTNDLVMSFNEDAVISQVWTILLTERGSRIYDERDFGCSLKRFLFEPSIPTVAYQISNEIETSILKYTTRVKNLLITVDPQDNTFYITIEFNIDTKKENIILQTSLIKIR